MSYYISSFFAKTFFAIVWLITVANWFNSVNAGRSYQSVLPQILAQQANLASDDDEDEDEDDE